jgi:hypothetical protein
MRIEYNSVSRFVSKDRVQSYTHIILCGNFHKYTRQLFAADIDKENPFLKTLNLNKHY